MRSRAVAVASVFVISSYSWAEQVVTGGDQTLSTSSASDCEREMREANCTEYFKEHFNSRAQMDKYARRCNQTAVETAADWVKAYGSCKVAEVQALTYNTKKYLDLIAASWNAIKKHHASAEANHNFEEACDKDVTLDCKRELAREAGRGNLSDEELRKLSSRGLAAAARNYKDSVQLARSNESQRIKLEKQRRDFQNLSMAEQESILEKEHEEAKARGQQLLNGFQAAASTKLKQMGIALACYNRQKQAELSCYAVGLFLEDPLVIGGAGLVAVRRAAGLAEMGADVAAAGQEARVATNAARDAATEARAASSRTVPATPVDIVSKDGLIGKVDAVKPPTSTFVKDQPSLAYRITSDKFEDIPEAIRTHLGSVDNTTYTPEYLRQNQGSVINLQLKDGKPDFYVIGKDTYDAKYASVDLTDVAKKNAKYLNGLNAATPGVADSPGVVAVLKKAPTKMIKMSDLGYDINKPVTIESPWGAQTKPAGQDAFLVYDESKKQYYMVNVGANGLPLSYVPLQ